MLTETKIKAAKAHEKPYKLPDGRGLHLLITPNGSRLWRFRYRFDGRENMLGLGVYPDVPLKKARARLHDARQSLADGRDPAAEKRAPKRTASETLGAVATEWFEQQSKVLKESSLEHTKARYTTYLAPYLAEKPLAEIEAPQLLAALRRVEAKGRLETGRRVRELYSRIARYGIATGRCTRDIAADLKGAIATPDARHFASLTDPRQIGELLRAIDSYAGHPITGYALKLAPYLFVRPGELRAAEWSELALEDDTPTWRIPAERMKMGEQHVVPLAAQVVALFRELKPISGEGRLVFPSIRSGERPISDGTMNAALRRLGYTGEQMTTHGFRSMASTLLNEQGWHPDVIELQLAHAERNRVRAAYNKAQRLAERRQMMQAWADYLDGLRRGGNVVAIRRGA